MKLLVVCQHYWPEPYPLADICEALAARGHEITVLTDVPNYPMGYIYEEYRHGKNRVQSRNGVTIQRCFTIGRRHNILFRFLNYYSYALSSSLKAAALKEEYDAVLAYQTSPVMMSSGAYAYAKRHGKRVLLYCLDLWPASLSAGGVGESSPIYRFFKQVSRRLYQKADCLLVSSRQFTGYLQDNFDIPAEKIGYLPQYAYGNAEPAASTAEKSTVDLLFAGNVGAAQNLSTALRAAALLSEKHPELRWHIVGDGSELENLKALTAELGLSCVTFYGRRPSEEMPAFYAKADALLVLLMDNPFISLTLPAKVQGYMAAGKPVLAAARGEIPAVLEESGCGFCAEPENPQALAEAVEQFLSCEDKEALCRNARNYYEQHFRKDFVIEQLEAELQALTGH